MTRFLFVLIFILLTIETHAQRHYLDTTLIIDNLKYSIQFKDINDDYLGMTVFIESRQISMDTIEAGGLTNIEFPDFNKDNYRDVMLTYVGNNEINDLYLFDIKEKKFKNVVGFSRFPEARQLKTNPGIYYSYHRAGCADFDWVSDLFIFKGTRIVQLGHIWGQGCEFEIDKNPRIIEIYKIIDNNENNRILIEKLPYEKFIPGFSDKWQFIEKYWNENFERFK
jgi:hypothetical protein